MKVASPVTDRTARLIHQLEEALLLGNAHVSFEDAVAAIPDSHVGEIPRGLPYSIWQLAEHIRLTQWDILGFCRDPQHKSPAWPQGYWPKNKAPETARDFSRSVEQALADRQAFIGLLHAAGDEIYTPFPYGDGQDLLREAILLIDHTSYHVGEMIVLRRLLGDWK